MEGRIIAFIFISFIGGILFAAMIGFYVHHEMNKMRRMSHNSSETIKMSPKKSAHVKYISYSPALMPSLFIQTNYPNQSQTVNRKRTKKKSHRSQFANPLPVSVAPEEAATKVEHKIVLVPPIHIEHSHENDTVDPVIAAAWEAYQKGDFDVASQHYSEVLNKDKQEHNSPNRDALLGMAAIAQQHSQDQLAFQFYNQLLSIDPLDPDAHAGMASLLGEKMAVNTESRLKILIAQHTESAALYFALGNHYANQSRWGEAEQAYFSACELESNNAQFAFNLAVSLDHLGKIKLAVQRYQRAMQLNNISNTRFDPAQTQMRLNELMSH